MAAPVVAAGLADEAVDVKGDAVFMRLARAWEPVAQVVTGVDEEVAEKLAVVPVGGISNF